MVDRPNDPIPSANMAAAMRAMGAANPIEGLMELGRASGPIFLQPGGGGGGGRNSIVWGFPFVDEISDDRRFDKTLGPGLVTVRGFVGDGLFTAYTEEPNWGKAHRILLPAFSQAAMAAYHPAMLDLASQLALKWSRLNPGETVDVAEDMTRLTLDTIGLCGFGYRFNSFYRSDLHPYVEGMVYSLSKATSLMTGGGATIPADPQLDAYRAAMNGFVDEIIATRKAMAPDGAPRRDLLGFMLDGVDKITGERLDDLTIRHEINTFLVAGHETTSGLLSFACYFLAKHPDVTAKAQAEVDRVFGVDASRLPSYEQVRELVFVPQVLKEALRLWPTAPGFTRRPLQPDTLGGRYAIAPDDVIRVVVPLLHRDPTVWDPNAEAFDPDNFAPAAEAARPANAYKPFGTGQRACIGRQFALQEAALVLGMLLQRFDLADPKRYELKIRQTLTIKPEGMRLAPIPRAGRVSAGLGFAGDPIAVAPPPSAPAPALAPVAVPIPSPAPVASAASATVTADDHGTPLLVLFGSNLGTAEDLAHRIANDAAARGYAPTVAPLDERAGALPTTGAVVVVTASYNGTPPDNAGRFVAWLAGPALAPDALAGVRYAVFGCGNHEWTSTYQAIPRTIDEGLAAHGAARVSARGEGDAAADFEDQVAAWLSGFWDALAPAVGLDPARSVAAAVALYSVDLVSAPANPFLTEAVRPLTVAVNRELQRDSERSTRHIELVLPDGVTYRTGDHLGVVPRNGIELVGRALRRFGFAGDAFVRIRRNGSGTPILPLDQPVAAIDLLSRYVDLQEVASRAQIETLAAGAVDPGQRADLLALAEDGRYEPEVRLGRVSVLDLLERFPACDLSFDRYLEMLHPLRVRYYSVSSSPLVDPRACSLTAAVVDGPARSGQGVYMGVASCYLARHAAGSVVDGYVRSPNLPFRPPADPLTPLVMVGPGTGLAPFRGFLQERAATLLRGGRLGEALLFYGCRHPDRDFIYRDELETWAAHGIVTLHVAASRPDHGPKRYVQDAIREEGAAVWGAIAGGGIVYVCGDGGKMEPAVRQAIADVAVAHGGIAREDAADWQQHLAAEGRYLADVWANG